jgi:four helix bundle protein
MIAEGYCRRKYKADFIKYLIYSHAGCVKTILHLDFLFETTCLKDENLHRTLKRDCGMLSKKGNTYITGVENNWNEFSAAL